MRWCWVMLALLSVGQAAFAYSQGRTGWILAAFALLGVLWLVLFWRAQRGPERSRQEK